MSTHNDFLFEIISEELPPKALFNLSNAFAKEVEERLRKLELGFKNIKAYATPRRLAILIQDLQAETKAHVIERKGPAKSASFDKEGKPTQACLGFARSCGVDVGDLKVLSTKAGEWMTYSQHLPGKPVAELLPAVIEQALLALPVLKRMRWGKGDVQFIRPVHRCLMLYGKELIPATILGIATDRLSQGHRFMSSGTIEIADANQYEATMMQHYVMVDFAARLEKIKALTQSLAQQKLGKGAQALFSSSDFLNEVTGLVEWPVALLGNFSKDFLQIPAEVLISAMLDHQRYFPVYVENKLAPHFITISNIDSANPERIIQGNERVLRARLADAAFFYETDKKESLRSRFKRLKGIVYQAKLGTLADKAERLSRLAASIASSLHADRELAKEAGILAKTDLTTHMVGEFPELQGVMGAYYATHDNENPEVAKALAEQYLPRFSGDKVAETPVGITLALADRFDTLSGAFGTHQLPSGDKDPYGLRRAAVGIIRTLIENNLHLDMQQVVTVALQNFQPALPNKEAAQQILTFIHERLRAWYQEKHVSADVFASVAALEIYDPLDVANRIQAVIAFQQLVEAQTLSVANKRVSNILTKYQQEIAATTIDPQYFDNAAEQELAQQLARKTEVVSELIDAGNYEEILRQLAQLRQPIDDFFDKVLVMTEDKSKRENRLLMLSQLRSLFLKVADIALLQ